MNQANLAVKFGNGFLRCDFETGISGLVISAVCGLEKALYAK